MSQWFYVENNERVGPVSEDELIRLVHAGTIQDETLVWNDSLDDWITYAQARGAPAAAAAEVGGAAAPDEGSARRTQVCCECGRTFPAEDMLDLGGSWVCAGCKPVAVQKLREGVELPGTMVYGGFWIRFAAKFLDWIIVGVINGVIGAVVGAIFGALAGAGGGEESMTVMIALPLVNVAVQLAVGAAYTTYFLGRFAATPGKMACGLKVVLADGGRVSYARAFGRHFAEMLSALTLMIGYIMAAFDSEKRALHDHICNTRVIRK